MVGNAQEEQWDGKVSEGKWKVAIVGHGEVDPRTLLPHPDNPKIHPPEQDEVIDASLGEFGWLDEVLINRVTGHMLDGHERVERAIVHNQPTVPARYCAVAAEDEGKVLMLLDPSGQLAKLHVGKWAKLQQEAKTPSPVLRAFFGEMIARTQGATSEDVEEPGTATDGGVAEGDAEGPLEDTIGRAREDRRDRGEELRQEWGTALGQLWQCGPHRVWCGDATAAEGWEHMRQEVGRYVMGCFTSPPAAEPRAPDYGGVRAKEYVAWFMTVAGHLWDYISDDGSVFVHLQEHSQGIQRAVYVHELVVALWNADWLYLDEFCWERPGIPGDAVVRGKFKNQWEPVFWFAKQDRPVFHPERARHWSSKAIVETRKGDGWAYAGNRLPLLSTAEALGHPAADPLELPRFFVEVYSDAGDVWVDPFGGSGTTMLACAETDRRCFMLERSPQYVAIALDRYFQEMGERPTRVA